MTDITDITVTVTPCHHLGWVECPRCWHWHPVAANYDTLCDTCQHNLLVHFPTHPSVPFIREALARQRTSLSAPCADLGKQQQTT